MDSLKKAFLKSALRVVDTDFSFLYLPTRFSYEIITGYSAYRRLISAEVGRSLNRLNGNFLRKSDTLFILGSGASINSYSKSNWQAIAQHDSIGFNYWVLHDFVPSFYCFEIPRGLEYLKVLTHNLMAKWSSYCDLPFILKGPIQAIDQGTYMLLPSSLKKNIHIPLQVELPGYTPNTFEKVLKYLLCLGCFQRNNNGKFLFSKQASLSFLVFWAYFMGYKQIVMCGVDLNNTEYFWETHTHQLKGAGLLIPPKAQLASIHRTLDPSYGDVTIDQVLNCVDNVLLKPNGIKLYVGSKKSALYPRFEYYFDGSHKA